jgi:hypothetical protein
MKNIAGFLKAIVGSLDLGDLAKDALGSVAEGEVAAKVEGWWKKLPLEERGRIASEVEELGAAMRKTAPKSGATPKDIEVRKGADAVGKAVAELVNEIRDGVRK